MSVGFGLGTRGECGAETLQIPRGEKMGWWGGTTKRRYGGQGGVSGSPLCFSCCGLCPRPWGPGGHSSSQLPAPAKLCVSPPTPATWLSAADKASVSLLVSGDKGHVWGQVYHLAVGSRFQGSRGLNAQPPRGPTSLGKSFPSLRLCLEQSACARVLHVKARTAS